MHGMPPRVPIERAWAEDSIMNLLYAGSGPEKFWSTPPKFPDAPWNRPPSLTPLKSTHLYRSFTITLEIIEYLARKRKIYYSWRPFWTEFAVINYLFIVVLRVKIEMSSNCATWTPWLGSWSLSPQMKGWLLSIGTVRRCRGRGSSRSCKRKRQRQGARLGRGLWGARAAPRTDPLTN